MLITEQKSVMGYADMAELADALDLGSSVSRRAGSTPVIRSKIFDMMHKACKKGKMLVLPFLHALYMILTAPDKMFANIRKLGLIYDSDWLKSAVSRCTIISLRSYIL